MKCAACGFSIPDTMKFCGECGTYRRGSQLVSRDSSTPTPVLRATSNETRATSPRASTEGVALATRTGDVSATVDLHTGYGIALGLAGDIRAYLEGARKPAALVDDSVSRDSASNVISASGYSSLFLGRHAAALEFGEQA